MGLSTEVPPIRSCLVVFKAVNDALRGARENLEYCLISNETYSQKEVEFQVDLSRPEDVDVIKEALKAAKGPDGKPLFDPGTKGVEYTTVKMGPKGKYSVPFICRFEDR
jgi:hypothetical protein